MENQKEYTKVLTIAVPSYNMEKHLLKNLPTYVDNRLENDLEVIILNNASTDRTGEIAQQFVEKYPEIFRLFDRSGKGYGSSINAAIDKAQGRYFRIVDADDWVDTEQLVLLIDELKNCEADVVQTNYQKIDMQTGKAYPVIFHDVEYNHLYADFTTCRLNTPCIHSTAYLTVLLKKNGIKLQDNIFFVDEEYVIMPFLYAKSVIYYDLNIYRYLVGNPLQSTSPINRAKYFKHREQIVKRLIEFYHKNSMKQDIKEYCFSRICQAAGDHLTTLYMFLPDRKEGRKLAQEWGRYIYQKDNTIYNAIHRKAFLLSVLNNLHVSLRTYEKMKKCFLHNGRP